MKQQLGRGVFAAPEGEEQTKKWARECECVCERGRERKVGWGSSGGFDSNLLAACYNSITTHTLCLVRLDSGSHL